MAKGKFRVECRYEETDLGAEPDFVEEVEAADADVAVEIVCDMDTGEHFVISKVSEWHEASGTWVDVDDPLYGDFFPVTERQPGL